MKLLSFIVAVCCVSATYADENIISDSACQFADKLVAPIADVVQKLGNQRITCLAYTGLNILDELFQCEGTLCSVISEDSCNFGNGNEKPNNDEVDNGIDNGKEDGNLNDNNGNNGVILAQMYNAPKEQLADESGSQETPLQDKKPGINTTNTKNHVPKKV